MLHKGLIQDGSSVGPEEVYDWLQWLNLAQLRKLSRIAKSLIEVEVTLH
jgi:AmiR/NasT family two-component response regulator